MQSIQTLKTGKQLGKKGPRAVFWVLEKEDDPLDLSEYL